MANDDQKHQSVTAPRLPQERDAVAAGAVAATQFSCPAPGRRAATRSASASSAAAAAAPAPCRTCSSPPRASSSSRWATPSRTGSKTSRAQLCSKLGDRGRDHRRRAFVGLDAYQKVIDRDVNYVILATPPGFRPLHLKAAVDAGKHIFTEKPVAVDGPGIRKVLAAVDDAAKKKTARRAGTQRRHQTGYLETMKRIHDGAHRRHRRRPAATGTRARSGTAAARRSGRHRVADAQLVLLHLAVRRPHRRAARPQHRRHQLGDEGAPGPRPSAWAAARCAPSPEYGHIFDHFAIDYEYPNGVHVLSMCRQHRGTADNVSEALVGTKGSVPGERLHDQRRSAWTVGAEATSEANPYVQEHTDLIARIRSGKPINELKNVAESTLTAIMGRMSAYTGKAVTWDEALNSQESLMPENLELRRRCRRRRWRCRAREQLEGCGLQATGYRKSTCRAEPVVRSLT